MTGLLLVIALSHASVISDGAEAFEAGELDRAIEVWDQGVHAGNPSGKLLFNLGNAWYRKGDLPRSIAYYRAAQRLRPRDGSVHHNLALVRSELPFAPEPVGPMPGWTALLTASELSVLGLLATAAGTAAMVRWWMRRGMALLAGALGVLALGIALSGAAWNGAQVGSVAVVVDGEATVRDAAQPDAGVRHSLPPGTEVRVLRALGDYRLVEDSQLRRGWLPRNALLQPGF